MTAARLMHSLSAAGAPRCSSLAGEQWRTSVLGRVSRSLCSGAKFVDPDFEPGPAALGDMKDGASGIDDTWLAVTDIIHDASLASRKDGSVYVFDANDVAQVRPSQIQVLCAFAYSREVEQSVPRITDGHCVQGALGDCWLVSAMQVLTCKTALFASTLVDKELRDDGCYAVRLWHNGKCQVVLVDDKFPVVCLRVCGCRARCTQCFMGVAMCALNCQARGGEPGSAEPAFVGPKLHDRKKSVWMMVLEKAVAKLYGSYGALDGGRVSTALVDFTGGVGDEISWESKPGKSALSADSLWHLLMSLHRDGHLLGAGTPSGSDRDESRGVYYGHAYAIDRVLEVPDGVVRERGRALRCLARCLMGAALRRSVDTLAQPARARGVDRGLVGETPGALCVLLLLEAVVGAGFESTVDSIHEAQGR